MSFSQNFYIPSDEEESENEGEIVIQPINQNLKKKGEIKNESTKENTNRVKVNHVPNLSNNADIQSQIDELRFLINSKNQQFEAEFDDLKRKNQEKLTIVKQNHIMREQSLSSSCDLEYRNAVWTTTLKHLNRGCFTEDLGPLFQKAISDEQYKLEKELIELKQKNEEELAQIKATMPKIQTIKQLPKKQRINLDILNPIEMAHIIYNKVISKSEIDDGDIIDGKNLNKIIRKLNKESTLLSNIKNSPSPHQEMTTYEMKPKNKRPSYEMKPKRLRSPPKRKRSPRLTKNERCMACIESHQKACHDLQKSMKKTDKFLKELKENDWFNDMFPHVD